MQRKQQYLPYKFVVRVTLIITVLLVHMFITFMELIVGIPYMFISIILVHMLITYWPIPFVYSLCTYPVSMHIADSIQIVPELTM